MNKFNNSTPDATSSERTLTNMTTVERRRFLISSAGKSAIVGAALANPIRSMAQVAKPDVLVCKHPTSSQIIMCSVSGMQSAIGSRQVNQITARGYSPGYWSQFDDKVCVKAADGTFGPNMKHVLPVILGMTWSTPVKNVLTFSTLAANPTLSLLMVLNGSCNVPVADDGKEKGNSANNGNSVGNNKSTTVTFEDKYANSEERHWMCAMFNAALFFSEDARISTFPYSWQYIKNIANSAPSNNRDAVYALVKSLEGVGV